MSARNRRDLYVLRLHLLDRYRVDPGNHLAASAGLCERATARRAWDRGWPWPGFEPLRDVLATQQALVRAAIDDSPEMRIARVESARLLTEQEAIKRSMEEAHSKSVEELEARRKEKLDAIEAEVKARLRKAETAILKNATETSAQEAQLVQGLRGIALSGVRLTMGMSHAINQRLTQQVISLVDETKALGPDVLFKLIRTIESVAKLTEVVINLDRKLAGEPSEVIQVNVAGMSLEDAAAEAESLKGMIDLVQRRGRVADAEVVAAFSLPDEVH